MKTIKLLPILTTVGIVTIVPNFVSCSTTQIIKMNDYFEDSVGNMLTSKNPMNFIAGTEYQFEIDFTE